MTLLTPSILPAHYPHIWFIINHYPHITRAFPANYPHITRTLHAHFTPPPVFIRASLDQIAILASLDSEQVTHAGPS